MSAKQLTEPPVVVKDSTIVKMAASLDQLKKHAEDFAKVKSELLNENDYATISGHKYIKKSGWYTFAFAFNLKTEIVREEKELNEQKPDWFAYHFTVRCIADNGRITEKVGSCDNVEKKQASLHVIRAMAETRATNRAIAAMVGGGEVSADEMEGSENSFKSDAKPNNPNNQEVCHCAWNDIKNEDGTCATCGKPLTVGQINTLYEMKKN